MKIAPLTIGVSSAAVADLARRLEMTRCPSCSASGRFLRPSPVQQVALERPRSLLHRGIFQDRRAVLPVEKFTDKGPTDIVLINRPKRS
jgi:hypothetical protein